MAIFFFVTGCAGIFLGGCSFQDKRLGWSIGVIACAWSFEWDVKGVKLMVFLVGFTGPLCLAQAIKVRRCD